MAQSIEIGKEALVGDRPGHSWLSGRRTRLTPLWRSLGPPQTKTPIDDLTPLFDAETLAELCGDIEPETLMAILAGFVEDLRCRLDRIAAAAGVANLRVLAFECHALSGCSHTFGALRLAGICRGIEQAVDDGDTDEALALARSLGRIGIDSLEALSAFRRVG
jgi:HPt (histidine-containing phosphotransfer) domain-containing protein